MAIALAEIVEFTGQLQVLGSGLRIGGSKEAAGIGETDNPIIRHPITNLPYVPGCSSRARCAPCSNRSIVPIRRRPANRVPVAPALSASCLAAASRKTSSRPPGLSSAIANRRKRPATPGRDRGIFGIEDGGLIDRNKGLSYGRIGPRTTERIPAGSSFDFALSLRYFQGDDVGKYLNFLAEGFELLEKHYLGGSGSRGYGQVAVKRKMAGRWPTAYEKKPRQRGDDHEQLPGLAIDAATARSVGNTHAVRYAFRPSLLAGGAFRGSGRHRRVPRPISSRPAAVCVFRCLSGRAVAAAAVSARRRQRRIDRAMQRESASTRPLSSALNIFGNCCAIMRAPIDPVENPWQIAKTPHAAINRQVDTTGAGEESAGTLSTPRLKFCRRTAAYTSTCVPFPPGRTA